MSNDEILIRTF